MKKIHIKAAAPVLLGLMMAVGNQATASSHREAPLIANDPQADNTDVYAFRSPDDTNTVTLIANYIPMQLPHGGPNYYTFGSQIRYEIHVDNNVNTKGDDIVYRFTFETTNEDPTTFFNIRLGKQNQKTTYRLQRSMNGGATFTDIVTNGVVPAYNIGPRSIESAVGLNQSDYESYWESTIATATTGEEVFAGPADDPFFVDLGGIFDLGDAPRQNSGDPRDGLGCYNVHTLAIKVPISTLQKNGDGVGAAANILDGDFVIGVWASASRRKVRTIKDNGVYKYSDQWVQVSRLGMPLTNEAVIPIGEKDEWNSRTPYNENPDHNEFFYNPELALYMDDDLFGGAVPAFSDLRIQRNSLGAFDFGNGNDGLYILKGNAALDGTALDDDIFGTLLLPKAGAPRSVDLWPIFHTGVPNFRPYQLATGKEKGNPLDTGKPFINNFLPNGGDMLRLNMAVPVTSRSSSDFSSEGLIAAAVAGLTDPTYANTNIEFIPNMDGFPNGRRLEDDVTRIELQAVGGIALAAIGLWYDDYDTSLSSPVTQDLLNVLGYTTGVESNDTTFRSTFPYVQLPWRGTSECSGKEIAYTQPDVLEATAFRCDGGTVSTRDGMDTVAVNNESGLQLKFASIHETSAFYDFIVTDENGDIVDIDITDSSVSSMAFSDTGTFRVYGISSTGTLSNNMAGDNISDITSTGCSDISSNFVTVLVGSSDANVSFTYTTTSGGTLSTLCAGGPFNLSYSAGPLGTPQHYYMLQSDASGSFADADTLEDFIIDPANPNGMMRFATNGASEAGTYSLKVIKDDGSTTNLSNNTKSVTLTECLMINSNTCGSSINKSSGTIGYTFIEGRDFYQLNVVNANDASDSMTFTTLSRRFPVSNSFFTIGETYIGMVRVLRHGDVGPWSDTCSFSIKGNSSLGPVEDNSFAQDKLLVYPNPATAYVSTEIELPVGEARFTLIDAKGNQVWSATQNVETQGRYLRTIQLNDLAPGSYFLTVQTVSETLVREIIKR